MSAMSRVSAAAVFGVALLAGDPSWLLAQSSDGGKRAVAPGSIHGVVNDDHGAPIEGAMVSALGSTTVVAVTNKAGHFAIANLSPGPYLLRAHFKGHVAPRAQLVQVLPNSRSSSTIALPRASSQLLLAGMGRWTAIASAEPERQTPEPAGTAGDGAPGPASETPPAQTTPDSDRGDWSETAWRMRHARRGVLKDVDVEALIDERLGELGERVEVFETVVGFPLRTAAGFLSDIPFSGQVNLLTTGSFDTPQQLLDSHRLSHGIAYLRLGAAIGANADWTVRGAFTEADISSWIVAGLVHHPCAGAPSLRRRALLQHAALRRRQPPGAARCQRRQPQRRRGARLRHVRHLADADGQLRRSVRDLRLS